MEDTDPNHPGSFAFLMRQILGEDPVVTRVAKDLGMRANVLAYTLSGKRVPTLSSVKDWSEKLHSLYDLDRVYEETGLTLRQMFENKLAGLRRSRGNQSVDPTNSEALNLLWTIGGRRDSYLNYMSSMLEMPIHKISMLTGKPELHSRSALKQFIEKLYEVFPENKDEILKLRVLLEVDEPVMRASSIKRRVRKDLSEVEAEFKQAAGMLIRELREKCEDTQDDLESRLKTPVLQGKLKRIEEGDSKLAASIYRDAIREVNGIYKTRDLQITAPYIVQLERMGQHLRR